MYTIKISDDNSVITTQRETIMQRSNIVDSIQFLTPRYYKTQIDMSECTVYMKYVLPISHKIKMTKLEVNDLDYKGTKHIQYVIPVNIPFTAEAGQIEISFTFIKLATDENGEVLSYVRKTQPGSITITPVSEFEQYEPDEMFSEIDQRLLMMEALLKDLDNLSQTIYDNMPTDVKLNKEDRELHLVDRYDEKTGEGIAFGDISHMVGEDLIGLDPDETIDGVIDVDTVVNNAPTVDLDKLLK